MTALQAIPTSGYASYCNFGFESSYGTAAVGSRTFGHGPKVTISRKNNMERIFALGSRNSAISVPKQYEGSASVEFVMSNGSFFRSIMGTVTDGGGSPYTHTYAEANTIPSFSILTGTELGSADEVTALVGCKCSTATITAAVNEVVKVRMECPYKTETLATGGLGSQVPETESPFVFSEGTLQLPSGVTIGNVQSVELTINNNTEGVFGLGSRFRTADVEKQREYNVKMTVAFCDVATLLTKFFGNAAAPSSTTIAPTATMVLTFTNGLSTTDTRSVVMTFTNVYLDSETLPKDVTEVIKEDVDGWASTCSGVVYSNNTTTDEGNP